MLMVAVEDDQGNWNNLLVVGDGNDNTGLRRHEAGLTRVSPERTDVTASEPQRLPSDKIGSGLSQPRNAPSIRRPAMSPSKEVAEVRYLVS